MASSTLSSQCWRCCYSNPPTRATSLPWNSLSLNLQVRCPVRPSVRNFTSFYVSENRGLWKEIFVSNIDFVCCKRFYRDLYEFNWKRRNTVVLKMLCSVILDFFKEFTYKLGEETLNNCSLFPENCCAENVITSVWISCAKVRSTVVIDFTYNLIETLLVVACQERITVYLHAWLGKLVSLVSHHAPRGSKKQLQLCFFKKLYLNVNFFFIFSLKNWS